MVGVRTLYIAIEPAEYTLAQKREALTPLGVEAVFLRGTSLASAPEETRVDALDALSVWGRVRYLFRALKRFDVVIVNSYSDWTSVCLFLFNALFFHRKMGIDADDGHRQPKRFAVRLAKAIYLRWLFTRPWCFGISPGFGAHRDLFRKRGMPEERIFSLPMCVDNARFACPPRTAYQTPFVFGYLGRLVPHKRVDLILDAFAHLPRGLARLEVVGGGASRATLEARAVPGVTFRGNYYGAEKVSWLRGIDCLVLASDYEPWGLVVNEALAAGVPCIVSDRVGCAPELITAPGAGVVFPAGDAEALADAMRRLAEHPEEACALGARGAAFMREKWNFAKYREAFEAMLREVQTW